MVQEASGACLVPGKSSWSNPCEGCLGCRVGRGWKGERGGRCWASAWAGVGMGRVEVSAGLALLAWRPLHTVTAAASLSLHPAGL